MGKEREMISGIVRAGAVGFLVTMVYVAALEPLSIFELPTLKTQDLFFKARTLLHGRAALLDDIVLIAVDDESVRRVGKANWPLGRRLYADLLDGLKSAGARVVAFDLIFSERGEPLDAFFLARAMKSSGNVILSSAVDADGNYVLPRHDLKSAARGVGVVNKLLDKDLFVRRVQLVYYDERGQIVGWPWEAEILAATRELNRNTLSYEQNGVRVAKSDGTTELLVPGRRDKSAKINYRFQHKDVNQIPFWKALETRDWAGRLRGKVVLVGATSKARHDALQDFFYTPLGSMPGVVVNMNFLANLMAKDFLSHLPLGLNVSILFLFTFLAANLSFRYHVVKGISSLAIASVGLLAVFFALFLNNYLGDFFTPLVTGWVVFLSIALSRYFLTFLENVQLRGKVVTDPLTGLYNRRALESRIDEELVKLAEAQEGERRTDPHHELSLVMLDIDDFKHVNDTHGHQFGDDVLKSVCQSIAENTRTDDLAARYGGEEFCVLLPHTAKEQAAQIAEKIREAVETRKLDCDGQRMNFTVSLGVAAARDDRLWAARTLIRAADSALYEAKKTGKNRVCSYHPGLDITHS